MTPDERRFIELMKLVLTLAIENIAALKADLSKVKMRIDRIECGLQSRETNDE